MSLFAPLSIDTRTLQPGELFVALDGVNQKGFTFIEQALKKNAAGVICSKIYESEINSDLHERIEFVDDPISDMALKATEHRQCFNIPVVGICGSVGKTSTKQFLSYLLAKKLNALATAGNLNNHLGLPMMVSRLSKKHEVAVFEMGADHVGDLQLLAQIAQPTMGILTPIAPEHLAGFGSLSGVYDGELEILSASNLKMLITVDDDPELDERLSKWQGHVIRVGFSKSSDFCIKNLRVVAGSTNFEIQGHLFSLPTSASFLALNATLAIAAATQLGLSLKDITGSWSLELPAARFSVRTIGKDIKVIDDTYNSSPKAFKAALDSLSHFTQKRKWVVFSDMLELGCETDYWHTALGDELAQTDIYQAWAFGAESQKAVAQLNQGSVSERGRWFKDPKALTSELLKVIQSGDLILFKGSRSTQVDLILKELETKLYR